VGRRLRYDKLGMLIAGAIAIGATGATAGMPPWPMLPAAPPIPADNPPTPAKLNLGKQLFFDARLSKDGTIACNSCHTVMGSGTDNRAVSVGIYGQRGVRSAPTVWNAAFNEVQFWDGRADSLEAQATGPLTNPVEMGMESDDAVVARLEKIPGYVAEFQVAFPGLASLSIGNVAKAIATYERTLITPNSPYDRYVNGDTSAMSAAALRGIKTAQDVGCTDCHSGANFNSYGSLERFPQFTDNAYVAKYKFLDDKGNGFQNFRVPTWRNIAVTAPYFHNGAVASLPEAVRVMGKVQLNIDLTEAQVSDIVEFMQTLTGEFPEQTMPHLPETPGGTVIDGLKTKEPER
jgi:cytochrome c peroxidase